MTSTWPHPAPAAETWRLAGYAINVPVTEGTTRAVERHLRSWLLLAGALAIHVIDEAATGVLDFYNPLVRSMWSRIWWFPMPTFTFGI